jgi:hypothetical protein
MEFDPPSLGIGLASGFATSFFANLSYDRFKNWRLRKKRGAGDYVTVTHSSRNFEFYVDETRDSDMVYSYNGVRIKISVKRGTGRAHIPAGETNEKLPEALGIEPMGDDEST